MNQSRFSIMMRFLKEAIAKGVVAEIFAHCRNLAIAAVFMTAGAFVAQNPATKAPLVGFLNASVAGYVALGVGFALLLLNLADGFHKLSKFRAGVILDFCLLVLYSLLSIRLVQILAAFHLRL